MLAPIAADRSSAPQHTPSTRWCAATSGRLTTPVGVSVTTGKYVIAACGSPSRSRRRARRGRRNVRPWEPSRLVGRARRAIRHRRDPTRCRELLTRTISSLPVAASTTEVDRSQSATVDRAAVLRSGGTESSRSSTSVSAALARALARYRSLPPGTKCTERRRGPVTAGTVTAGTPASGVAAWR